MRARYSSKTSSALPWRMTSTGTTVPTTLAPSAAAASRRIWPNSARSTCRVQPR